MLEEVSIRQVLINRAEGKQVTLDDLEAIGRTPEEIGVLKIIHRRFERAARRNNLLLNEGMERFGFVRGEEVLFLLHRLLFTQGKTEEEITALFLQPLDEVRPDGNQKTLREALLENIRFENVAWQDTHTPSGLFVLHATEKGRGMMTDKLRLVGRKFDGLRASSSVNIPERGNHMFHYIVICDEGTKELKNAVTAHELQHLMEKIIHGRGVFPAINRRLRAKQLDPIFPENPNPWYEKFMNETRAYQVGGWRSKNLDAYIYDRDHTLSGVPEEMQEQAEKVLTYLLLWEGFFYKGVSDSAILDLYKKQDFQEVIEYIRNVAKSHRTILDARNTESVVISLFQRFIKKDTHRLGLLQALRMFLKDFDLVANIKGKELDIAFGLTRTTLLEYSAKGDSDYPTKLKVFCDEIGISMPDLTRYYELKRIWNRDKRREEEKRSIIKSQSKKYAIMTFADLRERHKEGKLAKEQNEMTFDELKEWWFNNLITESSDSYSKIPKEILAHLLAIPQPMEALLNIDIPSFAYLLADLISPHFYDSFEKKGVDRDQYYSFIQDFFAKILSDTQISESYIEKIRRAIIEEIDSTYKYYRRIKYSPLKQKKRGDNYYIPLRKVHLDPHETAEIRKEGRRKKEELKRLLGLE